MRRKPRPPGRGERNLVIGTHPARSTKTGNFSDRVTAIDSMAKRGYFSPTAAEALARLFEVVHEGVYLGTLDTGSSETVAANPHLKLMFGFPADTPDQD